MLTLAGYRGKLISLFLAWDGCAQMGEKDTS